MNKVDKKNTHIYNEVLFESFKLIRMNKVCRHQIKLESFTNNFLNQLF